jgi:hypothetical protein
VRNTCGADLEVFGGNLGKCFDCFLNDSSVALRAELGLATKLQTAPQVLPSPFNKAAYASARDKKLRAF